MGSNAMVDLLVARVAGSPVAMTSRSSLINLDGPEFPLPRVSLLPAMSSTEAARRLRELATQDPAFLTPRAARPTSPATASEPTSDPMSPTASPSERLSGVMVEAGVPAELAASFTETALACAALASGATSVHHAGGRGAPETAGDSGDSGTTDQGTPDSGTTDQGTPDSCDSGFSAPASLARAGTVLSVVESVTQLASQLDAVRLDATRQLTAQTGGLLLADKGLTDPGELSRTARDRWRSRVKCVTRHEIEAALGWGEGEVQDLVALANTPTGVTGPVRHALATAEASWVLVRRFFRACSGLSHEDSAAIANGLFGDDAEQAVCERLTADGELTGDPWRHKEFNRALDREVAKIRARDPEAEATRRQAASDRSDVRVDFEDGAGALVSIGCDTAQGAAIVDRIERAARAARQAGDPRTLRQLRTAVACALLLHGSVDFGDLSADPDLITVEQSEQLTKILHALPSGTLDVIVPFTMLAPGAFQSCTCGCTPTSQGSVAAVPQAFAGRPGATTCPGCSGSTREVCPPSGEVCPSSGHLRPDSAAMSTLAPDVGTRVPDPGIAEGLGRYPMFLSVAAVWDLLLTPGSAMHRLVTDPTTGRCLERSTSAYRFTAAQRAQILAADRFCRAPGCLRAGVFSQVDHVQEHGTTDGDTRETNGQLAHAAHHDLKTKGAWDATINADREVTWTTLLGRIYRSKAHDYNQYTKLLRSAIDDVEHGTDTAAGDASPEPTDHLDRPAAIDRAIYTALSYRSPGAPLLELDDWDESVHRFIGWGTIALSHRTAHGYRRYQPHPDRVAAERRRHAATAPGGPDRREGGDRTSSPGPEGQDPLQIDPVHLENAPRLDDPALLDGPPAPPPDDYRRYAEPPADPTGSTDSTGSTGSTDSGTEGPRSTREQQRSSPWNLEKDDPPPF